MIDGRNQDTSFLDQKLIHVTQRRLRADLGPEMQPVIDALRGQGMTIRRVAEVRQSLEDLFLDAVAGEGGQAGADIKKRGGGS